MSHCSIVSRRARVARRIALGLAACAAILSASFDGSEIRAQSIVTTESPTDNSSFQSFSTPLIEKVAAAPRENVNNGIIGGFALDERLQLDLPAPKNQPKEIDGTTYRIPFSFPANADSNAAVLIELLASPDRGASWYPYASSASKNGGSAFLFEAPEPGEYWFALRTQFQNGKSAYSSTRAYRFVGSAPETLTLDDSSAVDAPAPLSQENEPTETFMLNNASFALEDDESVPQPPAVDSFSLKEDQEKNEAQSAPRPGKLKSLAFGSEKGSERLLVTVRWFRPDEIEPQYQIVPRTFNIERAPSPKGPWTIVGEDLDIEQKGYSWIATPDEMQPFYVRTVVYDAEGNAWRDVTPSPMDVSDPGVRSALGAVKTPAPFPKNDKKDGENSAENSFISNTVSSDETAIAEKDDALQSPREVAREKSEDKLVSGLDPKSSVAPRRKRPNVPAPTNPNEFQINPLFTKGFGVIYQAAQTRLDSDQKGVKRSIFTPPDSSRRVASVRPAERRRSPQQIALERARKEREKLDEQARYNKEHEMELFDQKPELMEGRMFYIDSNGNMSTTPPPEMTQALGVNAEMLAQGWVPSDQANGAVNSQGISGNAGPVYMPRDTEAYDSSARSGAATYSNNQYPQASTPGASPINERYSGNGAAPAGNDSAYRAIPETSYSPYGGAAPVMNAFPPRPSSR